MPTESEFHSLLEKYRRLRVATEAVVNRARDAGADEPMCAVEPWLIRDLRRELAGTPQPHSKLTWMSPT